MALTPKQQRFVDEYLIDLNGTQAAIRAGYSQKTAEQISYQLLQKTSVAEAIAARQAQRAARTEIDADWVLQRLALEADADLADLYDENGSLKPVSEWPKIWRTGLVAGVETQQEFEQTPDGKRPAGVIHKVRLSDRVKRLELIGKHLAVGAFVERHEHSGPNGGPIQTEELAPNDRARKIAFLLQQGIAAQKLDS